MGRGRKASSVEDFQLLIAYHLGDRVSVVHCTKDYHNGWVTVQINGLDYRETIDPVAVLRAYAKSQGVSTDMDSMQ